MIFYLHKLVFYIKMKVWSCILLCGIFAYTNSILRIKPKEDHRVINVPQETVREYSNEEYSEDTNNLENVRKFITRTTTLNNRNMELNFRAPRVETLTDFIQKAVHILNTYEDTAFEDFFHILDSEIRKYHYRGCKFSELMHNYNTRRLVAGSLKVIRGKPVAFTKASINEVADMLGDEKYDKNVEDLLDYINSLYINTELNFHSVLNELKYYRNTQSLRTHNNLEQVIRSGLRAILFDAYTELNTHTRSELKKRIETFWEQFKNNSTSSAEVNDIPYTDSAIYSFKGSENIMNEVPEHYKYPKHYSKNDSPAKSKNKRERNVSLQTYGEQFQRDKTGQYESSNESGKQINYNTDEISSGQSFDSSSNSIKNSQERREQYNTQRYMTLYTEEISYKAKTTKKTEIIPKSENMMTRRPIIKKRRTTTSTSREKDVSSDTTEKIEILRVNHNTDIKLGISNSTHDTGSGLAKLEPRAREKYDKSQKHGTADESRSNSKQKIVEIIKQYDAVIDVQLANTELLKSLGRFEPLRMDTKYDTTLYPKSDIQTEPKLTKSTIHPRSTRSQVETKLQNSTASSKFTSTYAKGNKSLYITDIKKNIAPVNSFKKDKNEKQDYLRRSGNDTIGAEDFHTYVVKKINAMENEIKELKQMKGISFKSRMNDNNTDVVEHRNVTDRDKIETNAKGDSKRKDMKGNTIESLLNEYHDLNNKEVNNGHNYTTINNTTIKESSTNNSKTGKLDDIKKVIDTKNTTQVTNNQKTATLSVGIITNATKLQSVVTTPALGVTRRNYVKPSFYDSQHENRPTVRNSQFDTFFEHINDGIDLHM